MPLQPFQPNTHSIDAHQVFSDLPVGAMIVDPTTISQKYCRNVSGIHREVPLVLKPEDETQVAYIIQQANLHKIPLYPLSTGKNWGLGSKLPVVNGCALVDLSLMNKILEINPAQGYAVLEPGVTQGQLARHLAEHFPNLTFNLTGTFGETSVLGNTLDRGDGGAGPRIDDLIGVRGYLGNGKSFAVGGHWGTGGKDTQHVFRYAAGPDLVGLFTQSNYAITTQIIFRLMRRPERRYVIWGEVTNSALEPFLEALDHLFAQKVVPRATFNLGYANRFLQARTTLGDTSALGEQANNWNFFLIIDGAHTIAEAMCKKTESEISQHCESTGHYLVDSHPVPSERVPDFLRPILQPLRGFPDYESIQTVYKLTGTLIPENPNDLNVDETAFGMKSYIAVVPPSFRSISQAARIIADIRLKSGMNIKPSFFGDGRSLTTIHFRNDDPDQVKAAEHVELEIWNKMTEAGYPPYRVSIEQMERLCVLKEDSFEMVSQLKTVFDPNGILSPGRYSCL